MAPLLLKGWGGDTWFIRFSVETCLNLVGVACRAGRGGAGVRTEGGRQCGTSRPPWTTATAASRPLAPPPGTILPPGAPHLDSSHHQLSPETSQDRRGVQNVSVTRGDRHQDPWIVNIRVIVIIVISSGSVMAPVMPPRGHTIENL